jgi:hypothetical protein
MLCLASGEPSLFLLWGFVRHIVPVARVIGYSALVLCVVKVSFKCHLLSLSRGFFIMLDKSFKFPVSVN